MVVVVVVAEEEEGADHVSGPNTKFKKKRSSTQRTDKKKGQIK